MAHSTPAVNLHTLSYFHDQESRKLELDTPEWYTWLETATTFAFSSASGTFTARKEVVGNRRGGYYWKAYRKRGGKLYRAYLGKTPELNLNRLNEVAAILAQRSELPVDQVDSKKVLPSERNFQAEPVLTPSPLTGGKLLETKLFLPGPHPHMVKRPRLVKLLEQANASKLILISAPPGFGKTTLLADWLSQSQKSEVRSQKDKAEISIHPSRPEGVFLLHPSKVAWISLDAGDNDPVRFWSYFNRALENLQPGLSQDRLGLFGLLQTPAPEQILADLINTIAALPEKVILVLDDYHLIETAVIHEGITFLLDHLPPRMQIVITSRIEPPLSLARLRVRGTLTELKANDLRFTPEEAATFLQEVTGLNPSAEEVALLESRTEGWIAGLQLAALSMRGREDLSGFQQAFSGNHRFVLDYLTEEVLQRQPEKIQQFLLETSFLERFNPSLCAVVTQQADSEGLLEKLIRDNLFVVGLDEKGYWYRYHHLFADFLRYQLNHSRPADYVSALYRRASGWYAQHGLLNEALNYALSGQDFEYAASLVEQISLDAVMRGEMRTVLSWLTALPEEIIIARPRLCLSHAWALTLTHQMTEAKNRVSATETALTRTGLDLGQSDLWDELLALKGIMLSLGGEVGQAIVLCQEALKGLGNAKLFLRLLAMTILANAYSDNGDTAEALRTFKEVIALSRAANHKFVTFLATGNLAFSQILLGHLREARQTCQEVLQITPGETHISPQSFPSVLAHILLGDILRESNELKAASLQLQMVLDFCKRWNYFDIKYIALIVLARVRQAQNESTSADELLAEAALLEQKRSLHNSRLESVTLQRVWLWLVQGKLETAARWAQGREIRLESPPNESQELEYLTLAKVKLAQGRLTEVQNWLKPLLIYAQTAGRIRNVIMILVMQSLILQAQGQTEAALTTLEQALKLAEPENFIRIFADEGAAMGTLLRRLFNKNQSQREKRLTISREYLERLLAACGEAVPEKQGAGLKSKPPSSLLMPLSEREVEVLGLLARGLSGPELAQELVLSPGTVKWHIKNVYSKLEVHNRTQALIRAKELNLL